MPSIRTTEALVLRKNGGPLQYETISLGALGEDQAIVEVYATGLCHTDLTCMSAHVPFPTPSVLGHEGAGVIVEVGSNLSGDFKVGDPVGLSFNFCNKCVACEGGHPAYCQTFRLANSPRPTGYTAATKSGESAPVLGHFFGQSSFARYAIVERSSLVKLAGPLSVEEISLLAPLGCGLMTGAGSVINTLQVRQGSSFAIFGAGAVGLGAMMAAKIAGASTIIAVDLVESRLELAKELGATHVLLGSREDLVQEIRKITASTLGVEYAIDATGVIPVIENMIEALGTLGKAASVGISRPGLKVSIEPQALMSLGKSYTVVTEGDAIPQKFIPWMIAEYKAGRFALDKLVKTYPIADFQSAIDDMHSGKVIKPVLVWKQ